MARRGARPYLGANGRRDNDNQRKGEDERGQGAVPEKRREWKTGDGCARGAEVTGAGRHGRVPSGDRRRAGGAGSGPPAPGASASEDGGEDVAAGGRTEWGAARGAGRRAEGHGREWRAPGPPGRGPFARGAARPRGAGGRMAEHVGSATAPTDQRRQGADAGALRRDPRRRRWQRGAQARSEPFKAGVGAEREAAPWRRLSDDDPVGSAIRGDRRGREPITPRARATRRRSRRMGTGRPHRLPPDRSPLRPRRSRVP